jgi:hypothetical protein
MKVFPRPGVPERPSSLHTRSPWHVPLARFSQFNGNVQVRGRSSPKGDVAISPTPLASLAHTRGHCTWVNAHVTLARFPRFGRNALRWTFLTQKGCPSALPRLPTCSACSPARSRHCPTPRFRPDSRPMCASTISNSARISRAAPCCHVKCLCDHHHTRAPCWDSGTHSTLTSK